MKYDLRFALIFGVLAAYNYNLQTILKLTYEFLKKFGYKSSSCYLCRPLKEMPCWSTG